MLFYLFILHMAVLHATVNRLLNHCCSSVEVFPFSYLCAPEAMTPKILGYIYVH